MDTDYTLKLYNKAHIQDLDLREPQLSDYYKPSVQQKQGWNDLRQRNGFGIGRQSFLYARKRKWKDYIVLKAFGRDWLQWRGWLKKPECLKMMQSLSGWSKPPGKFICLTQKHILRPTFVVESPDAVLQADLLFLPNNKATARLWKVYKYALTVVVVASRFKAAELLSSKAFQTIYKRRPLRWRKVLLVDPWRKFMGEVTREM